MDLEYGGHETEYILPCAVNVLFEDDITIEFTIRDNVSIVYYQLFNANCIRFILNLALLLLQSRICFYWVCLYSEEKLQTKQNNLKVETLSTGVKRIDYRQCCYWNKHLLYA